MSVSLSQRRILVVEDEALLAMELEDLLERWGCNVLGPVPSVSQALAILDREQPDAVVLDVNLMGERATPVAQVLLQRGVPFVVLTGYSSGQLAEPELREAPLVSKPVDATCLQRALTDSLWSHR